MEQGPSNKALQDLETLFKLDPEKFKAHYLAGLIRIGIGEDEKALENLIKAGSLQDGHAEIWSHIANLWNRLGEPEKALAAIQGTGTRSGILLPPAIRELLGSQTGHSPIRDHCRTSITLKQLMWLESEDSWVLAHSGYLAGG